MAIYVIEYVDLKPVNEIHCHSYSQAIEEIEELEGQYPGRHYEVQDRPLKDTHEKDLYPRKRGK